MARPLSVSYTPSALREISGIYRYIARDNPNAAAEVLAAIDHAIELLCVYPRKSRAVRRPGLRALPPSQYPYIIFFRIRRTDLEILHVLHAARRHPGFQEEQRAFVRA